MFSIFWLFLSDLLVEHFVLRILQRQLICFGCVLKSFVSFKMNVYISFFVMFRDVHCKSWGPVRCYRGSEQLVKPSRTPPSLTNVLQVLPKRHSFPPPPATSLPNTFIVLVFSCKSGKFVPVHEGIKIFHTGSFSTQMAF